MNLVNYLLMREVGCHQLGLPSSIYYKMKIKETILAHSESIFVVLFDHVGKRFFTGGDDNLIKIWSIHGTECEATLAGHNHEICQMSLNNDNNMLASGSYEGDIFIWDLQRKVILQKIEAHSSLIECLRVRVHSLFKSVVFHFENFCVQQFSQSLKRSNLISRDITGMAILWNFDREAQSLE